jgi:RNA polymerase sigma-70 factor (ECF subfamily)
MNLWRKRRVSFTSGQHAAAPGVDMTSARKLERSDAPSDAALALALADSDEGAFRLLYRRYVDRVRSALAGLADTRHLDDMTQEVFLRIWRSRSQLRTSDSVAAWIYRIGVNVAMDQLRSRRHVTFRALAEDDLVTPDPQNAHDSRQAVAAALDALDFDHRATLVLHDLEELTDTEVGEVLGIPRGTVKSRLHHARRRVREFLESKGISP